MNSLSYSRKADISISRKADIIISLLQFVVRIDKNKYLKYYIRIL